MKIQSLLAGAFACLFSVSSLAVPVVLDITFDDFPEETYFGIWDSGADTSDMFAGIAYDVGASSPIGFGDGYVLSGEFSGEGPGPWQFIWDLGAGDYVFNIRDTFGDGICCVWGAGEYSLSVAGSEIFAGGEFGTQDPPNGAFSVDVPAPATLALFGLGFAGLGWSTRKNA